MNTDARNIVLIYIKYLPGDFESKKDYDALLTSFRNELGWTFLDKIFIVVKTLDEAKKVRSENIDKLRLVISTRSAFFEKISKFAPYKYVEIYADEVNLKNIYQIVRES